MSSTRQPKVSPDSRPDGFALGLHANIPECCVRFYVANQDRIQSVNARRTLEDIRRGRPEWDGVEYVMCSDCLRAFRARRLTPARIHICVDSLDGPLCHCTLSGPDRVAGVPIKDRYELGREAARLSAERHAALVASLNAERAA